jgi:P2-related tail formation protein
LTRAQALPWLAETLAVDADAAGWQCESSA